jgi:hypothetical protein
MPTTMLSEHFSLAEFTYSETAARQGLDNTPTPQAYSGLERLAEVMEEVRRICGNKPVTITSGYRGPQVNAAVGGSTNSAHMVGLACDFIVPGAGDPLAICKLIEPHMDALGIDQLIWEFGDWVHLGLATNEGEHRCQCLTINNAGTQVGWA